jgi:DNA-binding MarR family transcriptional regulator
MVGQIGIADLDRLQDQLDELRVRLSPGDEEAAAVSNLDSKDELRLIRHILRSRRRRDEMFGHELFGEPAWDLLLELYAAEITQQKISVSSACLASAVPQSTALRWIAKLEKDGWVKRKSDPLDGRRYWLFLTPQGVSAMRSYLAKIGSSPID